MSEPQRESAEGSATYSNAVLGQLAAERRARLDAAEAERASGSSTSTSTPAAPSTTTTTDNDEANLVQLRNDLLPSPPSTPSATPSSRSAPAAASSAPRSKPVTVADLKGRSCWICSDGDAESPLDKRTWIHPCACSLVAHDTCLRRWIRHKQSLNQAVQCPQCTMPYLLIERKSTLLQVGEAFEKVIKLSAPFGAAVMGGAAVLVASTAFGCVAIRAYMGKEGAARLLGKKWPWTYYFEIPLIPIVLLGMRTVDHHSVFSWFPTILGFTDVTRGGFLGFTSSGLHIGVLPPGRGSGWTRSRQWNDASRAPAAHPKRWPPSPHATLLLAPWIRTFYIILKRRVTRHVLSSFIQRPRRAGPGPHAARRQTRIVFGPGPAAFDAGGVQDVGRDGQGRPRDVPAGVEAIDGLGRLVDGEEDDVGANLNDEGVERRDVYATPASLSRLIFGTFSVPFIAAGMGSLLGILARASNSPLILRLLGMKASPSVTPTPSASAKPSTKSPLASLFSGGGAIGPSGSAAPPQDHAANFGWNVDPVDNYADLDPVWLRNAVGLGVWVVLKDVCQLYYRAERLRHQKDKGGLVIVDKAFAESMVGELELRDE